jgi:YidC/Oxa1 family membrane protein insertase
MKALFNTLIYQPIFNLFVWLYAIIPDVGVVILLVTLIVKIVLYPLTKKSIEAQKELTDLQPKLEALKQKHKGDQQTIAQETMKLYKEHKVNPFGSCLPILVQLPIFLALYWVFQAGLTSSDFNLLYSFVPNPGTLNTNTLGFLDLSKPNAVLAILAGLAQYWQAKMMIAKRPPKAAGAGGKDEDMAAMMNKQMLYFMPILTVFIGFSFPGGLALYWLFSTVFTIVQQYLLFRNQKTVPGIIEGEIVEK